MSEVQARQQALIQEFSKFSSWEDRYKAIIERGKKMPLMADGLKTEDRKVKGCQSQVWLEAQLTSEKTVHFQADSDALIVKGLIAILLEVYDLTKPQDILQSSTDFLKDMGFEQNLSPSRSNGLFSVVKQIKNYALAFDYLSQLK